MESVPARPLEVNFFAVLREQAGRSSLTCTSAARNPAELYRELQASLGLVFPAHLLRVAVNDRYATMATELRGGDRIVFIPPVAGG